MKRDTLKAYRARNTAMDDTVTAAVTEMRAERDAQWAKNKAAYEATEAARTRYTRDDIAGATAVRTHLYGWRLVRRINQKTVSIDSGHSWAVLVKLEDVLAYTTEAVKA